MKRCDALLAQVTERLRRASVAQPRLDARLLLAHGLSVEAGWVFCHPEYRLNAEEEARIWSLVERRERREPVSRIVGHREFWSLPFKLSAATLDPRPDTETLVDAVLAHCAKTGQTTPSLLDLGTGSGCILLALLSELPGACGLGVDLSPEAAQMAAKNAEMLGLGPRARFVCGDWGTALTGAFDVITANPPYIPDAEIETLEPEVAYFDPRAALAGGGDGLSCYRALAPDARRLLKAGGLIALEVGWQQAPKVAAIFQSIGLNCFATHHDLAGHERCLLITDGYGNPQGAFK